MLKSSRLNLIIITTISHDFKRTNSTYSSVWLWSNQDLYAMTEQLWRCHAHSTRQSVFPHHNTGTTHNHTVHPNDCFFKYYYHTSSRNNEMNTTKLAFLCWPDGLSGRVKHISCSLQLTVHFIFRQNSIPDFFSNIHKVWRWCRYNDEENSSSFCLNWMH